MKQQQPIIVPKPVAFKIPGTLTIESKYLPWRAVVKVDDEDVSNLCNCINLVMGWAGLIVEDEDGKVKQDEFGNTLIELRQGPIQLNTILPVIHPFSSLASPDIEEEE